MRLIIVLSLSLTLFGNAWAAGKDATDPDITTKLYGFMLLDMLQALGDVHNEYIDATGRQNPQWAHAGSKSSAAVSDKRHVSFSQRKKTRSSQPVMEPVDSYLPKTMEYKGSQMWGEATAKVRADSKRFDVHVTCTLPMTMWTLKTSDGTEIGSNRLRPSQAVEFSINEPFIPPYTLILNVIYMDMPNLLKIKMEKAQ